MRRRNFLSLFGLGSLYPLIGWALPGKKGVAPAGLPDDLPAPAGSPAGIPLMPMVDDLSGAGPKICLLACGGMGITLTRHLDRQACGLARIVALDTSSRALQYARQADQTVLLRQAGQRKATSIAAVQALVQARQAEIQAAIGEADMLIVVAGMGGMAGSGIASMIAAIAPAQAFRSAILTLPFEFESTRTQQVTRQMLQRLDGCYNNILPVANARLASLMGPEAPFDQVLQQGRQVLDQYLNGTSRCLMQQGLVGLDFEDVKVGLNARKQTSHSRIGWGQAHGNSSDGRAERAVRQALDHPLLDGLGLDAAESVAVSIRGGPSLRIREINAVIRQVELALPDTAHQIIFAANVQPAWDDQFEVSLILGSPANYWPSEGQSSSRQPG